MSESRGFMPGNVLVFQVESGFVLLRVLDIELEHDPPVWHIAVYREMYFDVDTADQAASEPSRLQVEVPHVALTNRAFESTQVSRLRNVELDDSELGAYRKWQADDTRLVDDRSIRLILGLR